MALPRSASTALVLVAALLVGRVAWALDKQGSAHGGSTGVSTSGFDMSGAISMGVSLYNPTYAARPNNTGLALMRYAGHLDLDLIGQRLSIPLDINMFSDRLRGGAAKLAPSELDVIAGVTSTWALGPGALEMGTRFEQDRQVGAQPTFEPAPVPNNRTQSYVDARARYLVSAAGIPRFHDRFPHSDVNGWLTLGWFAYNPSYFARPDNTGRALFRYAVHTELSLFDDLVSFGLDAIFFTDRTAANPLRPSELDLTPEIIFHRGAFELHLAYEIDIPLDRGSDTRSYTPNFLYLLGVWSFDLVADKPAPLEQRGEIL
jgi:hypothetical protein